MQINNKPEMFLDASRHIFKNAKLLRNKMTQPEKLLWEVLRNYKLKGLKFRRQHPIHDFVADFYCHKAKLVIEIDGCSHNSEIAKEADQLRSEILNDHDIKIIRFSNDEVLSNLQDVIKKIDLVLEKHLLTP